MSGFAHFFAALAALTAGFFPGTLLHYIAPQIGADDPHVKVLFGGDMLFDRSIRATMEEKGGDYLFSCIDSVLQENNLVVANLEGPITNHRSVSLGSTVASPDNFTFTFPLSTAELLLAHNIKVVNLGNNHITNFGLSGVRSSISSLQDAGVGYFGDPIEQTVAYEEINGVPLAFINYNEFEYASTASTTMAQIRAARAADWIPVVYTHWGIEYATTAPAYSHELAHRFIDAGAEIVVGSHPHVVQDHELYAGKHIYYSLGNFIFDQYWMESVRSGLLVQVTFNSSGVAGIREIPIYLGQDRRTCTVL